MELNGRWFPQIVDRDSGNLYPIHILHSLVLILISVGGGVGVYLVKFANLIYSYYFLFQGAADCILFVTKYKSII